MRPTGRLLLVLVAWSGIVVVAAPSAARGVGDLLSPGPLSAAHSKYEGIKNCDTCHEPGKGVSTKRCLSCHKDVATRISEKRGVHREVSDDCVACHVEHAGRDADIRPLVVAGFDHSEETGFPLDGLHARLTTDCAKCHTTRSYLKANTDCASCHKDVHKGALGTDCARCHSTAASFKETGLAFDHSTAAYPLAGAHQTVQCAQCHREQQYKGLRFSECSDCHRDPHGAAFGAVCASCHNPAKWATTTVNHSKTEFPLTGLHASVACVKCHPSGQSVNRQLRFERCTDCHTDVHQGTFTGDCAACHAVTGFKGAEYDHRAKTQFPLDERHLEIPCVACHKTQGSPTSAPTPDLDFRGLTGDCASCHKDVHRGQLGTTCATCHGTRTFRVTTFQHASSPEFFKGKHLTADCTKCHRDAVEASAADSMVSSRHYRGLSNACATCHQDVHLGQLGPDCAACHTVDEVRFSAAAFDHSRSTFNLTGKHSTIECVKCHKRETGVFPSAESSAVRFKGVEGTCQTCHQDTHLGQLGDRCESCHGSETFKLPDYTHRTGGEFFDGKHGAVQCVQCHVTVEGEFPAGPGKAVRFSGLDQRCATCHEDAHRGTLGPDCASCHNVFALFRNASRAFHKDSLLPLEGRHVAVPCAECHWNGQIRGTPTRCYDCHWIRRQDDRFRTALGAECEHCHRPISWTAVAWDHTAATGQDLGGAHFGVGCESCHTGGRFDGSVPTDCVACHLSDYQNTDDPDHVAGGFPIDCENCHSPSGPSWEGPSVVHSTFPLIGAHTSLDCNACHSSGVYQGLRSECVDCHLDEYNATSDPNHQTAEFPTDCETCHRGSDPSWEGATFAHSTYPLVGSHTSLQCNSCHSNGVYQGLPSECVDCHLDEYNSASDPNHQTAGFPTDCETCHRGSDPSWEGATFAHSTYPLVGSHTSLQCNSCHSNGVYQGLPSECVDCHLDEYNSASDPNHQTAGFPTDCETCHRGSDPSWEGATFAHSTYPLVGSHTSLQCNSCHSNGVYQGLPSECVDCHLDEYNATSDPNHQTAGFPSDCEICHSQSSPSWEGASFAHSIYPLVGSHASLDCSSCHASGVYSGLLSECVDCHLSDYQNTDDPNHQATGFPTDCETCHRGSDPSWEGATFAHSTYPLVGSHTSLQCNSCHSNGVYQGLPSECVDCHLNDYQSTNDPDHQAAGFPTDCEICHRAGDSSWNQGTFDHVWFPIDSGPHRIFRCSECHTSSGTYAVFSCTTSCHPRSETNGDHEDESGYSYNSAACYSCHPDGQKPEGDR